jgi:tetratricopeptide (TPR) repeat protein
MALFTSPPSRKGEHHFERARAAELRGDFAAAEDHFRAGAEAFDAHLAKMADKGEPVRPAHLTMAGICYTRLGRNRDALDVLDRALAAREIPDAYLHAGYAAAKSGDAAGAAAYWSRYPDWAEQPFLSAALREQAAALGEPDADPDAACLAVAKAVQRQDRENAKRKLMTRGRREVPHRKWY